MKCKNLLRKNVFLLLLLAATFTLFCKSSYAEQKSSISQYGITWHFDGNYECGQFVTGDWWVVGPVTITTIDPAPSPGRNGACLNPMPKRQGYDDRSKSGSMFSTADRIPLPSTININNTLVSAVSKPETETEFKGVGVLQSQAVLTIVDSPMPANAFRPGYCGTYKQYFTTDNIDLDIVPNLQAIPSTPNGGTIAGYVDRPHIDHMSMYTIQYGCAEDNWASLGHSPCYGKDYCEAVSLAAMYAMLDAPYKFDVLYSLIQIGIDNYSVIRSGGDWSANGGHHSGRKFPIVFAGKLLNDQDMSNIGIDFAGDGYFGEDDQTYYGVNGKALWGADRDRADWFLNGCIHVDTYVGRDARDPAGLVDGCCDYRCGPTSPVWVGQMLTTLFIGAKDVWAHDAYFDYIDRFMNGETSATGTSGSSFIDDMWDLYRDNLPQGSINIPVTGVTLPQSTLSMNSGEIIDLDESVLPADATSRSVIWSSNDETIAYVNSSGVVTAVSEGATDIIVTTSDGGFTAHCTVTVNPPSGDYNVALFKPVAGTSYQSPNEPGNLVDGMTDDDNRWSADGMPQSAVIDLGEEYNIIGVQVYTYQGRAYQYTIEAMPEGGNYSLIVDRSSNSDGSQPITDAVSATARYVKLTVTGASGYTGTWVSINELMLIGSPTSGSTTVNVTGITVSPETISLSGGQSSDITESVSPVDATNKNVTWATNNASVASVDANGLVTAISPGTATITATTIDGGYSANCYVTVTEQTAPPVGSPIFFWDMESDIANIYAPGSDSTAKHSNGNTLSTLEAYEGAQSMKVTDAWSNCSFSNETNTDVWSPVTEGTLEFYWQYQEPWTGRMIFKIQGLCNDPAYDTEDALKFQLEDGNEGVFRLTYAYQDRNDGSWNTPYVRNRSNPVQMVDGQWYHIKTYYEVGRGLAIEVDGVVVVSDDDPLGLPECLAWHGLDIGNDTYATGTHYVDNFAIYDHWVDETSEPVSVSGVSVSPTDLNLEINQTSDLTETVSPSNATNKNVTWATSDASVASVDANGVVTAISAGNATITVSTVDGGYTANCNVIVNQGTPQNPNSPVFFWDMESNVVNIYTPGSDSIPSQQNGNTLSDSEAYEGNQSLEVSDDWSICSFENDTNEDVWSPVTVGTFELYWQYHAPWSGREIFKIAGLSHDPDYDTEDALKFSMEDGNEGVFKLMYTYSDRNDGSWNTPYIRNRANLVTMVEGQWYHIRVFYATDLGLAIEVDGVVVASDDTPLGLPECLAWHGLNLGNDTYATGTHYIDNFAIYDYWVDETSEPVSVSGVSVSPTDLNLEINQTSDLTETVSPSNATNKNVTWATSDASVASVDANGVVTAISEGNATITVTTVDGGYTANCNVDVNPQSGQLVAIASADITAGDIPLSVHFSANASGGIGNGGFIENNGELVIEAENYMNTVSNGDVTDWVESISLEGYAGSAYITTPDNAVVNAAWGSACEVQYDIAVSTSGTYNIWLYRYSPGTGSNSAFVGIDGISLSYYDNDNNAVGEWSWVNMGSASLNAGTHIFSIQRREDGYNIDKIIITTNSSTPTGNAQAESAKSVGYVYSWDFGDGGTSAEQNPTYSYTSSGSYNAILTVSDGTSSVQDNVTISATDPVIPCNGVSVSPVSVSLEEGGAQDLTETVAPTDATDKSVSWTSSNTAVATVDANGLVSALSAGNATITVTTTDGGFTAQCAVEVTIPVIPVTGVSLAPVSISLEEGETQDLTETVSPANATDKSVSWSSSNSSVATVDANGVVSALSGGQAIVTVATNDGGYTATCDVTVTTSVDPTPFLETFGTGTAIDFVDYTGWDNGSPIVYSGASTYPETNEIASSPTSNTYDGASGGSHIQIIPGYNGSAFFQIDGVNTLGLTNATLSFGYFFQSWSALQNLEVSYSTDGTNWTLLPVDDSSVPDWSLMSFNNLPSVENLSIKFEEFTRKAIYIDDISITDSPASKSLQRIDEPKSILSDLLVYPNPVAGNNIYFHLSGQKIGKQQVEIYNMNGQRVYIKQFSKSSTIHTQEINVGQGLKSGLYLLKVSNEQNVLIKKITVK